MPGASSGSTTAIKPFRAAFRARFGEHHALVIGLALGHVPQVGRVIATLDARTAAWIHFAPSADTGVMPPAPAAAATPLPGP